MDIPVLPPPRRADCGSPGHGDFHGRWTGRLQLGYSHAAGVNEKTMWVIKLKHNAKALVQVITSIFVLPANTSLFLPMFSSFK